MCFIYLGTNQKIIKFKCCVCVCCRVVSPVIHPQRPVFPESPRDAHPALPFLEVHIVYTHPIPPLYQPPQPD